MLTFRSFPDATASCSRSEGHPMPSLRVGSRGQITIPSSIRRELQLEVGSLLVLQVRDEELILRRAGRSVLAAAGDE